MEGEKGRVDVCVAFASLSYDLYVPRRTLTTWLLEAKYQTKGVLTRSEDNLDDGERRAGTNGLGSPHRSAAWSREGKLSTLPHSTDQNSSPLNMHFFSYFES